MLLMDMGENMRAQRSAQGMGWEIEFFFIKLTECQRRGQPE